MGWPYLLLTLGVYQHKQGKGLEYHAVKILGWGVESDGTPYWTCANPWSKRWGSGGFFKVTKFSNIFLTLQLFYKRNFFK